MDYKKIQTALKGVSKELLVNNYLVYIQGLVGGQKSAWAKSIKENIYINLFKKAVSMGLVIDGDSVTLTYRKAVLLTFSYQAYKNLVMIKYPDTIFDIGLVHEGDTFQLKKESGSVTYNHGIKEPFANNKKIIGAYCVIKNSRGEFIETLNNDEITKMRNVAKTDYIWKAWYGEMVLKSVIKRGCKRHFKDITEELDKLDNEHYDLDKVSVDSKIQESISECVDLDALTKVYEKFKDSVDNKEIFLSLVKAKKQELNA